MPDGKGVLTQHLVNSVYSSMDGQDLLWLGNHEAICFNIEKKSNAHLKIWSHLQLLKIDMVVQKKETHFKSLLLADMDSTMIEQECIDELADICGVGSEVKKITNILNKSNEKLINEIESTQNMRVRLRNDIIGVIDQNDQVLPKGY